MPVIARFVTIPAWSARPRRRALARALAWLTSVTGSALLALASAAAAHDFWIEPSSFTPRPGDAVTFQLRVGERFAGEVVPRSDAMIARFVAAGPDGEQPVRGADGVDPAGIATFTEPGLYVVGYRSRPSAIELDPAKFATYLESEGLQSIASLRAARGDGERPARERYSRCAKALLAVGPESRRGGDTPLGFTLELIAETNPATLVPGDSLPLRLTYDGAPIAGVLVSALHATTAAPPVAARTDAAGRVALPLGASGPWLVKAVHMVAVPPGEDAEWESYWASLTFALPDAQ
jgi:hypothetical protein